MQVRISGELPDRIARHLGQLHARRLGPRKGDGFVEQDLLGPEMAEEGDLVHPRGLGDAARGGAAVPRFGVDAGGGFEELVADVHGGRV